ncbi:hypothetical protein LguiA_017363 [Lonicera macranthoides]
MENIPPASSHTIHEWRSMYGEALHYEKEMRKIYFQETMKWKAELRSKDLLIHQELLEIAKKKAEIEQLRSASSINFGDSYRSSIDALNTSDPRFRGN